MNLFWEISLNGVSKLPCQNPITRFLGYDLVYAVPEKDRWIIFTVCLCACGLVFLPTSNIHNLYDVLVYLETIIQRRAFLPSPSVVPHCFHLAQWVPSYMYPSFSFLGPLLLAIDYYYTDEQSLPKSHHLFFIFPKDFASKWAKNDGHDSDTEWRSQGRKR